MMSTIVKRKPTVGILPVPSIIAEINKKITEKVEMIPSPKSKNSLVAISGNRAEDILCNSPTLLEILGSTYFGKTITKCEKITGRKKSDLVMTFDDGTKALSQLKNGTGGGRGWSFDRRQVDKLPTHDGMKDLLRSVCLKSGSERNIVANDKELLPQ
jgi:hypothetical protein